MPLEHIQPENFFTPRFESYTPVIVSTGARQVHVAGMTPVDENNQIAAEGDLPGQVRACCDNIKKALASAGATVEDVVRVNIYALDIDQYLEFGGPEFRKMFTSNRPTSTLLEISRLSHPGFLVEIEVTAVLD